MRIPLVHNSRLQRRGDDRPGAGQTYSRRLCPPSRSSSVDDGSTDNTAPVLAGYGDKIRVVRQANRGLPAARNAAVAASRGELLALIDHDDEWIRKSSSSQSLRCALIPPRPCFTPI